MVVSYPATGRIGGSGSCHRTAHNQVHCGYQVASWCMD